MKTAGVIGGLAAPSTKLFYDEYIRLSDKEQVYPQLIINSLDINEFKQVKNHYVNSLEFIQNAITEIDDTADFASIVCNTAHYTLDSLRETTNVPILGIHEETCKRVSEDRVGVLGTATTTRSGIYQKELLKQGKTPVCPPTSLQLAIDEATFDTMVHNEDLDAFQELLQDAMAYFNGDGCEAVILACTEYPLFISPADTTLTVYSSTHCLARSTVETQLSEAPDI